MPVIERRSAIEIEKWLITYIARETRTPETAIDPRRPLDSHGLDSVTVVAMTSELEDWLGVSVEATLPYRYPTISQLSSKLAA